MRADGTVGDSFMLPFEHGTDTHGGLPTFPETWMFANAFIADRPVMVYGRGYDFRHLRYQLDRYAIPTPNPTTYCGLQLARRLWPGTDNSLQAIALRRLLDADQVDAKRRALRAGRLGQGGGSPTTRANKWVLHNAQEDAWACASLVQWVARYLSTDLAGVLTLITPRPLQDFKPAPLKGTT